MSLKRILLFCVMYKISWAQRFLQDSNLTNNASFAKKVQISEDVVKIFLEICKGIVDKHQRECDPTE